MNYTAAGTLDSWHVVVAPSLTPDELHYASRKRPPGLNLAGVLLEKFEFKTAAFGWP